MWKRLFRCDRHKTRWQRGAFATEQSTYDPSIWPLELDSPNVKLSFRHESMREFSAVAIITYNTESKNSTTNPTNMLVVLFVYGLARKLVQYILQ